MPTFFRLVDFGTAEQKDRAVLEKQNIYKCSQRELQLIPGLPLAYWIGEKSKAVFSSCEPVGDRALKGLDTGGNIGLFVRLWYEVSHSWISIQNTSHQKWFPLAKGGEYRKWYGNNEYVINYENRGLALRKNNANLRSETQYGKRGITWTVISVNGFAVRYMPPGFLFDQAGSCIFPRDGDTITIWQILASLNSNFGSFAAQVICPTISYTTGDIRKIPILAISQEIEDKVRRNVSIVKSDWDLRETSWDFRRSPLLTDYSAPKIETVIDENLTDWSWPSAFGSGKAIHLPTQAEAFKCHWTSLFLELHKNEEENNRIFIDLYGLQDELSPEVPYNEITILQEELVDSAGKENRIEFDDAVLARQFVSYGVGCLFGRYSVEQDGLILADAESTAEDFKARVPGARFLPDGDGVLPLTDEDDFADDLPTAFKSWLRFISGEHYNDNLRWIEQNLGRDLRTYFVRDFYKEHIKRYKNRPIYWMISSPSGAFRAVMYLHRYNRDTIGKVLNDYVRPYRAKLDQKIRSFQAVLESASESATEKSRAKKRLTQLEKYRTEIEAWERDLLYPLALKRIELDLDDGVKVNYRKLSGIVEPIKQLEAKDEE
nr:BREX-1 system adenine-specific DNA-methyltransferase PglX [Gracilinema caldarium]